MNELQIIYVSNYNIDKKEKSNWDILIDLPTIFPLDKVKEEIPLKKICEKFRWSESDIIIQIIIVPEHSKLINYIMEQNKSIRYDAEISYKIENNEIFINNILLYDNELEKNFDYDPNNFKIIN